MAYSEVAALTNFTNGALIVDTEVEADFAAIRTPVNALISGINDGTIFGSVTTGITASTTQSQGQQALTAALNVIATVANANDVVTLPAASAGTICVIINAGANSLRVYPASGDAIEAGVDTPADIGTFDKKIFVAVDSTNWWTIAAVG